jgi:hypothetical protein
MHLLQLVDQSRQRFGLCLSYKCRSCDWPTFWSLYQVAVSCDYGEVVIRGSSPIISRASVVNETDGILGSIYHVALQ